MNRQPSPGRTIWITGLVGSGKTTLGRRVYERLRQRDRGVVLLDADAFREVIGHDLGYGLADRLENARRLGRMCRLLSAQGLDVVCPTMSLFEDCHRWNRANLPGYFEVYLRVPFEELVRRDQKQLYSRALRGEIREVVGVDLPFTPPQSPDLVLDNSGPYQRVESLVDELLDHLDTHSLSR